jgi:hypothetical protein
MFTHPELLASDEARVAREVMLEHLPLIRTLL